MQTGDSPSETALSKSDLHEKALCDYNIRESSQRTTRY